MEGIAGLQPREPVGAVVSVGVKHPDRGFPVEKDRFHIVLTREDSTGRRPHHPAFKSFNSAEPDRRRVIRGNIVHSSMNDCFEYHLKAQVIKEAHPDKRPACIGDGLRAERWEGPGRDDFVKIKCPNERCEFRLMQPPKSKPWMRFLFRLSWPDGVHLPTPLVKYTSGSWNTTANFLGFFKYLTSTARELGLERYSLFGVPFIMTLTEQTKASARSRFPVVTITPAMDPIAFWAQQSRQLEEIKPVVALPDPEEASPEVQYDDYQSITIGGSGND